MKKVTMIRFGLPVSKVLKNSEDLSFYHSGDLRHSYLDIFYDGNDFILVNNHNPEGKKDFNPRKVYVAKTNVSQWELDDTVGTEGDAGVSKKVRAKADA
jgi:hypothetical protein